MCFVATVSDIRRDNARLLARECGGLAAFARRIDRADPYVSQVIGATPQRGLTDTGVAFGRWFESLTPAERYKLVRMVPLVLDKAVPDDVVEQKMPVTKRADIEND